jgi:recombinational DNA repair ATPase RecF
MEIIGVEFEHYASFSNCRVPINKGVTVLVGRNNVGKTALLRGLSILNLLASPPQPGAPELLGYVEQQQSRMQLLKAIVSFRVEQTDQFLEASADWWGYFVKKNPLLSKRGTNSISTVERPIAKNVVGGTDRYVD